MKYSLFVVVFLTVILFSCKKNDPIIETTEARTFLSGSNIAIALNYRYPDSSVYCLWGNKLTEPVRMPDINGASINFYSAKDLIFHNNELYSCGISLTRRGNGINLWRSDDIGVVWRNNFATPMSSITINNFTSKVNAIAKQDDNLYFAGQTTYRTSNFYGDQRQGGVWKGYQTFSNTTNLDLTEIYDVAIQNNDVYTCGLRRPVSPEYNQAVFYKNNVLTLLSDNERDASAKSVKVINNDVYVVYEQSLFGAPNTGQYVVYLWKNGQTTLVSNQNISSNAKDMTIHNGDVYIVGSKAYGNSSKAVYWKNGTEFELTTNYSKAEKILIHNNKVYIIGSQINEVNYNTEAVMWVDGVKQIIASKPGVIIESVAIAIK